MSKDLGAKCRKCRRAGGKLFLKGEKCFSTKCAIENRNYPPGQHGQRGARRSDYGNMLIEKQKLRWSYDMREEQFRRFYAEADRVKGATGENLLALLESRLDNVVYRMGLASSRAEARQLVRHKAILVNGKVVTIPSYIVQSKDVVAVRDDSQRQLRITSAMENADSRGIPEWLDVNTKQLQGVFKAPPERSDLPSDINEQLVVELYSK